ncbi:hypothetical protein Bpfe_022069 [Biomphalaria pfeifferi]|uniref:Uncharacterized protein n=1 Tax=Biomphalaria pfeifferi TaxID=112525 RepID=A0AAD8F391_BIOPF|nr:hypothetical protein Bpfe_022069 [Biomphalaria pfeifferi]
MPWTLCQHKSTCFTVKLKSKTHSNSWRQIAPTIEGLHQKNDAMDLVSAQISMLYSKAKELKTHSNSWRQIAPTIEGLHHKTDAMDLVSAQISMLYSKAKEQNPQQLLETNSTNN